MKALYLGLAFGAAGCALFRNRTEPTLSPELQKLEQSLFAEATLPEFNYALVASPEASLHGQLKTQINAMGNTEYFLKAADGSLTRKIAEVPATDLPTTRPLALGVQPEKLFLMDSRGRDTAALVKIDTESKRLDPLAENGTADLSETLISPDRQRAQAAAFDYDRRRWVLLDRVIESRFKKIQDLFPGRELGILKRSADDRYWLVAVDGPNAPRAYCVFDGLREKCLETSQVASSPLLEANLAAVETTTRIVRARDGIRLLIHSSQLKGAAPESLGQRPLLFWIDHGFGARFKRNFNPFHRYFAQLGYLVVSVDFRGSKGLGKRLFNAGGAAHLKEVADDFSDALHTLMAEASFDPKLVALAGFGEGVAIAEAVFNLAPAFYPCGIQTESEQTKKARVLAKTPALYTQCY